jgi:hypothetical protein
MTLTEPAAVAVPSVAVPVARSSHRPVSAAINPGAAALYAAAMPRGATPWHRHSHAFQGIYLQRAYVVLAAALDVNELADLHAAHAREVGPTADITCACGQGFDQEGDFYAHQARALRAWALGDPS